MSRLADRPVTKPATLSQSERHRLARALARLLRETREDDVSRIRERLEKSNG